MAQIVALAEKIPKKFQEKTIAMNFILIKFSFWFSRSFHKALSIVTDDDPNSARFLYDSSFKKRSFPPFVCVYSST